MCMAFQGRVKKKLTDENVKPPLMWIRVYITDQDLVLPHTLSLSLTNIMHQAPGIKYITFP